MADNSQQRNPQQPSVSPAQIVAGILLQRLGVPFFALPPSVVNDPRYDAIASRVPPMMMGGTVTPLGLMSLGSFLLDLQRAAAQKRGAGGPVGQAIQAVSTVPPILQLIQQAQSQAQQILQNVLAPFAGRVPMVGPYAPSSPPPEGPWQRLPYVVPIAPNNTQE